MGTHVGIRDLKQRTSELLRLVRERGESIDISDRGEVVARIVPVARPTASAVRARKVWRDIDRVAEEISKDWPRGIGAVRAMREARRG